MRTHADPTAVVEQHDDPQDDPELAEMVNRLNALMPVEWPWRWTKSRKGHSDIFGRPIRPGEHYLRRQISYHRGDEIKMSRASTHALLLALFIANPALEAQADAIAQDLLPLNSLLRGE